MAPSILEGLSGATYSDTNRDGIADLLCKTANWTDIALFYFANYIAHCATVKPYPAETYGELSVSIATALILPSSGVSRAMDSINRRTRFRHGNELEKAAIAGSLCMVVRSPTWKPESGDTIRNLRYDPRDVSPLSFLPGSAE